MTVNETTNPTASRQMQGNTHEGDLVGCPECGNPAIVEWTANVGSTDGHIEHLKIRCVQRHWYLLPAYLVPGSGFHAA
jgi:hypothetical protein